MNPREFFPAKWNADDQRQEPHEHHVRKKKYWRRLGRVLCKNRNDLLQVLEEWMCCYSQTRRSIEFDSACQNV